MIRSADDDLVPGAGSPALGIGLIGTGRHSEAYLVPAISAAARAGLAAVCGHDPERTRRFAERHGIQRWYTSVDQLLDDATVTAVVVASPNHLHEAHVAAALAAKRPVLCEKPLSNTVAGARKIALAVEASGLPFAVGFHLRHNPVHRRVAQLVKDGAVGAVLVVEVSYAHATSAGSGPATSWRRDPGLAGGGQFVGTGVHAADLVRFIAGEVAEVTAVVDRSWLATGVETVSVVGLGLANGAIASVTAGRLAAPDNRLAVHGDAGSIVVRDSIGNLGGGSLVVTGATTIAETIPRCDPYTYEIDDFAGAVLDGRNPAADVLDGLRATEITDAVYRSVRERLTVSIPLQASKEAAR